MASSANEPLTAANEPDGRVYYPSRNADWFQDQIRWREEAVARGGVDAVTRAQLRNEIDRRRVVLANLG